MPAALTMQVQDSKWRRLMGAGIGILPGSVASRGCRLLPRIEAADGRSVNRYRYSPIHAVAVFGM